MNGAVAVSLVEPPREPGFLAPAEYAGVIRCAPLVCVDLLIRDAEHRVLLGMRRNNPARGFWFTLGGRVRKNERISDAVARVLDAELGVIKFEPATFVGTFEHFHASNRFDDPGFDTHCIILAFEIVLDAATLDLQPVDDQHSALTWMSLDQLRVDELVHPYIREYFAC